MEMDSDFKKKENRSAQGGFYRPLSSRPHANHVPVKVEGVYDYHGVGGIGGEDETSPPMPPTHFI